MSNSVLKSIFERRGGRGQYTMPFKEFPLSLQNDVLSLVYLKVSEEPLIGCIRNDQHWVLITTTRVIRCSSGEVKWIDNSDIKDANVDLILNNQAGATAKDELIYLKIITDSNQEMVLELEPGLPYFGIWNMLKHFAAQKGRKEEQKTTSSD